MIVGKKRKVCSRVGALAAVVDEASEGAGLRRVDAAAALEHDHVLRDRAREPLLLREPLAEDFDDDLACFSLTREREELNFSATKRRTLDEILGGAEPVPHLLIDVVDPDHREVLGDRPEEHVALEARFPARQDDVLIFRRVGRCRSSSRASIIARETECQKECSKVVPLG